MSDFRISLFLLTITSLYKTTNSAVCSYSSDLNKHSLGSTPLSNVTTIIQCQDFCTNTGWCSGVDWDVNNPNGILCWLSRPPVVIENAKDVTHFTLSCSTDYATAVTTAGCNNWNPTANTHTLGGKLQSYATSIQICQSLCLQDSECPKYGIDWNSNNPVGQQCFFCVNSTTYAQTGVTHYSPQCTPNAPTVAPSGCWRQIPLLKFKETIIQPYSDLIQCQNGCLQTTTCYGIDWYAAFPSTQQCYFATSTATDAVSLNDPNKPYPYHSICSAGNSLTFTGCLLVACFFSNFLTKNTKQ